MPTEYTEQKSQTLRPSSSFRKGGMAWPRAETQSSQRTGIFGAASPVNRGFTLIRRKLNPPSGSAVSAALREGFHLRISASLALRRRS